MKIIQALYGKLTSSKIIGVQIKPELIIEGKKFESPVVLPGYTKTKVLFVVVENERGIKFEFLFRSTDIIIFDLNTNNHYKVKELGFDNSGMFNIEITQWIDVCFRSNKLKIKR